MIKALWTIFCFVVGALIFAFFAWDFSGSLILAVIGAVVGAIVGVIFSKFISLVDMLS